MHFKNKITKSLVIAYRSLCFFLTIPITGTVSFILVLLSVGLLRNFCVKYLFKYNSRFLLHIFGYSCSFPKRNDFAKHQVLYTINHNSYLDGLILTALGLPNVRFLFSEKMLWYFPIVPAAKAIGTFYVPQKKHARRRLTFFKRMTRLLQKRNFSIMASAEGVHEHSHSIHPFNKGIFHMALEAHIPILPLFIYIPKVANPFKGIYSKGGEIKVFLMNEIDNSRWELKNLRMEIDKVQQLYVTMFNKLNRTR